MNGEQRQRMGITPEQEQERLSAATDVLWRHIGTTTAKAITRDVLSAADAAVPVVTEELKEGYRRELRAVEALLADAREALEQIRDGLFPHRERLSSQQAKNAYDIAACALGDNLRENR